MVLGVRLRLKLYVQIWLTVCSFMPPEIVRPLATTTIGTLVVLAHRMGMVWRDLRPSRGFLRAEGNGHTFTSTVIRGLAPSFSTLMTIRTLLRLPRRMSVNGYRQKKPTS